MFAYCTNNPSNLADSDGHCAFLALFLVPGIAEFAAAIVTAVIVAAPAIINSASLVTSTYGSQIMGIAQNLSDKIPQNKGNKGNQGNNSNKSNNSNSGRNKNKLKPDSNAEGDHTTYKRNPDTGEITNYETWKPNPKNPTGFDSVKRYDGIGRPHMNPLTGEELMPHVHDKAVPGGVRAPIPWEVPAK
jgi:hypothetical protein